MEFLETALVCVSIVSFAILLVLVLGQILTEKYQFWPPPKARSWQHHFFRLLFRLAIYPVSVFSLWLLWRGQGAQMLWQISFGATLMIFGFGVAFYATKQMGWHNAFGEAKGLMKDGFFAISRNPVYVATWVGLAGWALLVSHSGVTITLVLWSVLYAVAPLVEEPWLEREYGAAFRDYKKVVRRFL